ncbi:MAG: translation elongation factor Ts, partial [Eggerthellaceae bacterium]|nr:translation elongation factor Ts [Eggerthellaceae bacterium]
MAITASQVKELRDMTGAGMMECKKALTEADGNMDKAVDLLREWGVAKVAKKAGRATNEGTVMALVSEDGKSGVVIELNCETDFVGMNEKFKGYAENIAKIALAKKLGDAEAVKADEEVAALITDCVHVMGENTQLSRAAFVESSAVCSYIHMGGKIGVLMSFDVEGIDPTADAFVAYGR